MHSFTVKVSHFPDFKGEIVHPVCSTYVLAREIEWSTRLFMLDVIEEDEEGIGTMIEVIHKSPAFIGEIVQIEARLESFSNFVMICSFIARVDDRIVATGKTGQKLMRKSDLNLLYHRN